MMKVPFGTILITDKTKALIAQTLNEGRVSSGKYVRAFEERFAACMGAKHAVAVSSGTDADALALAVLYDYGAARGDEVIVPALSFVATGNAVLQAGFTPVFVDIERETLTIDAARIEQAITKKTRAIMPVHLMGKPAAMNMINEIAKKNDLYVIEDAAEAYGTEYFEKSVGQFGHLAAYSTYVAHIVSTGEGGVVTTNDDAMARILRSLRCHGRACDCVSCTLNTDSAYCPKRFVDGKDIRFSFERVGYSAKMNELEAAIGLGVLPHYDEILARRRHNLHTLTEMLKPYEEFLYTLQAESYERIGPHAFGIVVNEHAPFTRDGLMTYFEEHGVETRSLFSSMPTQCPGFSFLGYRMGDFPCAEDIGRNGLHIGVHQDLTDAHLEYVADMLSNFIDSN